MQADFPPSPPAPAASTAREIVIDTNVVLDWLAFGHPLGPALGGALGVGRWRWIATRAMRDELAHVIVRPALARWSIDADRLWDVWDARATEHEPPALLGVHERLTCTDPDDQKFIDLAVARRADTLLTRDRAVLKLASRARRLGVLIATPEAWLARLEADPTLGK